jgi:hypothetical protein
MPLSRAAWTLEDSERLKQLVESGVSPARASVIFKRSVGAVQNQARKLGVPFPPRHDIRREILAKCDAAEKSLRD